MAYESLQAILEEAGMSHQELSETPYGTADGSNKTFTTAHKPLSDQNYDDVVDKDDVLVLVNGSPVTVESVNAQTGSITLAEAPANGAEIIVEYRYSSIALRYVEQLRREAEDWVNKKMAPVDPCAPYTGVFNPGEGGTLISATVQAIVRIYAAAQLLIRDYGYNQDTELTSKDGYKKLALVVGDKDTTGLINDFIGAGGVCGGDDADFEAGGVGNVVADSAGDLFGPFDGEKRPGSEFGHHGSNY